jgi:hypothetical protein
MSRVQIYFARASVLIITSEIGFRKANGCMRVPHSLESTSETDTGASVIR